MGCSQQQADTESDRVVTKRENDSIIKNQDIIDLGAAEKRLRKNSHVSVDFHCRYRPEEMATQFLEFTNYVEDGTISYS